MSANTATPLHRLTALFRREESYTLPRTNEITITYFASLECEISIRAETPQAMSSYLSAAFMPGNSLLTRMKHPLRQEPVHVEIPGEIIDPLTRKDKEKCLARLTFIDHDSSARLSFNDDGVALEGPSLKNFITALNKAGNDWEQVDLRPVQRMLRLVTTSNVPKP